MRFVPIAVITAVLIAGCDDDSTSPSHRASTHRTYTSHGLTVELSSGWRGTRASLTPDLGPDPREVLAVANYPLRYRPHQCAHVPVSALEDLGRSGAFIDLEERTAGADPSEFPERPARFGPSLGGPSEAAACAPGTRMSERFFGFTDHGRHFYALVAFGPAASPATRAEAWRILDSLKVEG